MKVKVDIVEERKILPYPKLMVCKNTIEDNEPLIVLMRTDKIGHIITKGEGCGWSASFDFFLYDDWDMDAFMDFHGKITIEV